MPRTSLAAAAPQAAVAQEKNIVIGQSIALTGPGSALAAPFQQGAKMYFDRVNAAGGVNGRKIELVTLDDRGNPKTRAFSPCSGTTGPRRSRRSTR